MLSVYVLPTKTHESKGIREHNPFRKKEEEETDQNVYHQQNKRPIAHIAYLRNKFK